MEFYFKIALEILLLWYFIYMVLYFVKGTRTEQLLKGLVIIAVIFVATQYLRLEAINWVLSRIFPISVIALLVIFQPELRHGLARLGQFGRYGGEVEDIEEISRAAIELSRRHTGMLIALEREVGLKNYIESGVKLDAKISEELIVSLFIAKGPLHDGAAIIEHGRLVAAGCILPLSQQSNISKSLGTRHRAAIGLSEETDAICVIVSEETGAISLSVSGRLTRDLKEQDFVKAMKGFFYKNRDRKGIYPRLLSFLSPKPKLSP